MRREPRPEGREGGREGRREDKRWIDTYFSGAGGREEGRKGRTEGVTYLTLLWPTRTPRALKLLPLRLAAVDMLRCPPSLPPSLPFVWTEKEGVEEEEEKDGGGEEALSFVAALGVESSRRGRLGGREGGKEGGRTR